MRDWADGNNMKHRSKKKKKITTTTATTTLNHERGFHGTVRFFVVVLSLQNEMINKNRGNVLS